MSCLVWETDIIKSKYKNRCRLELFFGLEPAKLLLLFICSMLWDAFLFMDTDMDTDNIKMPADIRLYPP